MLSFSLINHAPLNPVLLGSLRVGGLTWNDVAAVWFACTSQYVDMTLEKTERLPSSDYDRTTELHVNA